MKRKQFVKNTLWGIAGISLSYKSAEKDIEQNVIEHIKQLSKNAHEEDEMFWNEVRQLFSLSKDIINLNNAAVSTYSDLVAQSLSAYMKRGNEAPSYYLWNEIGENREVLRQKLATYLNCNREEIAFNRNTTEALNTVIFGLPLQKDNEVILCKYDYPHMINAWKQREERDGIVLKWVDIEQDNNESIIIEKFQKVLSKKTKVVHLTHVMNWTGYALPIKQIITLTKLYGAEIIVDAAHAFGQMPLNIEALNCDYWAAPGHKWLCGPTGTGILFIKKQHIEKIFPLLSAFPSQKNDIRKFETLGVRNFAQEASLITALNLHEAIGISLIQKRLLYLKNYWLNKIKENKNIDSYTSENHQNAIGTVYFKNKSAKAIEHALINQYKIHTTTAIHEQIIGLRISPHIYTSLNELDLLIDALKKIA